MDSAHRPAGPPGPQDGPPAAGRSLRILVVDDYPIIQLVARKTIAREGDHLVDCAHNGLEALELWSRNRYDLIFMDVHMPRMDGLAATRAIRSREDPARPRVHICAVTANTMEEDRAGCLAAGMDACISKPIVAGEVHAILQALAGA